MEKQYVVVLSEAEEKALLTEVVSVREWLSNFAHASARRAMARIVEETTDKRAAKLSEHERESIVLSSVVETAAERGRKEEEKAKKGKLEKKG
jgi:hypothetical protein